MGGFWQGRPVLVTGASGFIGSWLASRLLHRGAWVIGLDVEKPPAHMKELLAFLDSGRYVFVKGDVRDYRLIKRLLAEKNVDAVFHLAARSLVPEANRSPLRTFQVNVEGTWSVLEACRRTAPDCAVIVASSDKAYGESDKLPYTEESPLMAQYPYDASKACADLVARCYAAAYRLPVAITRCGNVFGGGDLNWSRIVPGTIRALLNGERPVVRSDGTYVRDYIYVEDVVEAYLLLAERLKGEGCLVGETFNFSYEAPRTVFEVVELISQVVGRRAEPIVLNEASNEIKAQYLRSAKARGVLGWTPRHTLEGGLRITVEWYRGFLAERREGSRA